MNKKTLIIGLAAAVLIAAGVAYAVSNQNNDETAEPLPAPAAQTQTTQDSTNAPTAAVMSATITYTANGFSPASLKVSRGATITVKNDSTRTIQFDSDPHPEHTDNPELNVNNISAGQSMSFVVDKVGTWGYHDHLRAREKGTIVVQ